MPLLARTFLVLCLIGFSTAALSTEVENEEDLEAEFQAPVSPAEPSPPLAEPQANAGTPRTPSETPAADTPEDTAPPTASDTPVPPAPTSTEEPVVDDVVAAPVEPVAPEPFHLLEVAVEPGNIKTLLWAPFGSSDTLEPPVPMLVAHGQEPGPVLCLTAAVHGDEINGIEIVRQVMHHIEPEELSGTVIGVPIVNLDGFRRASRYARDRRDLNRHFPGSPTGSLASRFAHSFFDSVIKRCTHLVDVHTGSFQRTNVPQLRGNLRKPDIVAFTQRFGGIVVVHESGLPGTLRRAANDAGILAVTLETGGPRRLEQDAIEWGVTGIENLLHSLEMQPTLRLWSTPQPVYMNTTWVRAQQGGLLISKVELNDVVTSGDVLGLVVDPITNTHSKIVAPYNGRVVGMAYDQAMSPGFAAYHLGVEAEAQQFQTPPVTEVTPSEAEPTPTTPEIEPTDLVESAGEETLDTDEPLTD